MDNKEIGNESRSYTRDKMHPYVEERTQVLLRAFPGAEIITTNLGGGVYAERFTIEGFKKALERMREITDSPTETI